MFLGIKKIMFHDVHPDIIDLDCGDIHIGICPINSAEWHGKKSHGAILFAKIQSTQQSREPHAKFFLQPKAAYYQLRTH